MICVQASIWTMLWTVWSRFYECIAQPVFHCVKSVQILVWLFLVRIFLYLGWKYSPNTGKYGPEITPYLDTFHTVFVFLTSIIHWCPFGVFNLELISHITLVCPLLNLSKCWVALHKEWSFPLRISSINLTKSARIFPNSDWIRWDITYLSVFSPNMGKYVQIW